MDILSPGFFNPDFYMQKYSLEGLHIFPKFYITKRNYYDSFSRRFSLTFNSDVDFFVSKHTLIAKLTRAY